MAADIIIQVCMLLLTLSIFYALHKFPKHTFTKLRKNNRFKAQAHRHFTQGTHLLTRARSTANRTTAVNLARAAAGEADDALAIDPKDAAVLILKCRALHLMGHVSAALKCVDSALTTPAVKSLSEKERGEALFTRAELKVSLNRKRRVDSAIDDLAESVKLSWDKGKAYCLLGQCFVMKGMKDEARSAFDMALRIGPDLVEARKGLLDLDSPS